jgi:hypothetical protein
MTLERRHAPRPRARPMAVALAVLAAGLMAATTPPNAAAAGRTLNVNPVTGSDTNPATPSQPLKALTKALNLAQSGDSVKLAAGTYGPGSSGDQFPASGLAVRSGVTIAGATDSGFPAATLIGPGSGAALNLAGDATVRNLALGGSGFGVGLFAKQGTQTLSNLLLATATGRVAVIDGVQFSAGIVLRGTAQATLNAGASQANSTGSTLFVNGATGVAVGQQARFTMRGSQIKLAGSANNGVSVAEQGRFTMDGGKITGAAPNCDTDANGISLRDAAQATLKTGARLENVSGFGISLNATHRPARPSGELEAGLDAPRQLEAAPPGRAGTRLPRHARRQGRARPGHPPAARQRPGDPARARAQRRLERPGRRQARHRHAGAANRQALRGPHPRREGRRQRRQRHPPRLPHGWARSRHGSLRACAPASNRAESDAILARAVRVVVSHSTGLLNARGRRKRVGQPRAREV